MRDCWARDLRRGYDAASDVIEDAGHVVYWRPTNQIAAAAGRPPVATTAYNTFLSIVQRGLFVSIGTTLFRRNCYRLLESIYLSVSNHP